jgi:stalled ribosome alternative rescue factor ArfA
MSNMAKEKGRQWDGKSRVSNETYRQNWNEIFNKNLMAKEVRTPQFKSQIVKTKKGKGSFKRKTWDYRRN